MIIRPPMFVRDFVNKILEPVVKGIENKLEIKKQNIPEKKSYEQFKRSVKIENFKKRKAAGIHHSTSSVVESFKEAKRLEKMSPSLDERLIKKNCDEANRALDPFNLSDLD